MLLKFKRLHEDAVPPIRQHDTDAGFDLTAHAIERCEKSPNLLRVSTGIALEIPKGHVGLIFPRSSIYKTGLNLRNSVGVIDSGYRGEIIVMFRIDEQTKTLHGEIGKGGFVKYSGAIKYKRGDRCCQLVVLKLSEISEAQEVQTLGESDRGEGGFGSTGEGGVT
tara:strand:+ start:533 stop:1027 length:495 start_codon:yes stop_codon:yes gene_type:complete